MFNHINWDNFNSFWDGFRAFLDTLVEWLMYVLADGPKPGSNS